MSDEDRVREAQVIVCDLAASDPVEMNDWGIFCTLCKTEHWPLHDETCPWLRAREWVDARLDQLA